MTQAGACRIAQAFVPLLAAALLWGCAGQDVFPVGGGADQAAGKGYLSFFLHLQEAKSPPLRIKLQSMDILTESGSWLPLVPETDIFDSRDIGGGQVFLARTLLPPGYYSRIRMRFDGPSLPREDNANPREQRHDTAELAVVPALFVDAGDSHSLFLAWDVKASLSEEGVISPVFDLAPRLQNLIADAAYVSCPEINTVYMIRTDLNRVYDSLGVPGGPTYLLSATGTGRENLLALTRAEPGVKRIGPSVNRVLETYRLPLTGSATHMALAPGGERAYIADSDRGTVMMLNLVTGQVEGRVRLGYGPSYIIYLEKQDRLAVALTLSQSVALLDPRTLATVGLIATGSRPEGMAVYNENLLYIAESGGNSVLVYDLERGREWKRIPVDLSPRRVLAAEGFIYVSNYGSSSISLLRARQLGVTRNIPLPGPPLELAHVPASRWVYVGNETGDSILIVDPATSMIAGEIALGARPAGLAIMPR
jgi:DNA-binding beta-propeller fold protein YncE